MIVFKLILFSFLINYCISIQIVGQSFNSKREKIIVIFLSILIGALAGLTLVWI